MTGKCPTDDVLASAFGRYEEFLVGGTQGIDKLLEIIVDCGDCTGPSRAERKLSRRNTGSERV